MPGNPEVADEAPKKAVEELEREKGCWRKGSGPREIGSVGRLRAPLEGGAAGWLAGEPCPPYAQLEKRPHGRSPLRWVLPGSFTPDPTVVNRGRERCPSGVSRSARAGSTGRDRCGGRMLLQAERPPLHAPHGALRSGDAPGGVPGDSPAVLALPAWAVSGTASQDTGRAAAGPGAESPPPGLCSSGQKIWPRISPGGNWEVWMFT